MKCGNGLKENMKKFKIKCAEVYHDKKETNAMIKAAQDFWLVCGKRTTEFENNFANYLGMKYCILTNSGSSANLIAVSALTSSLLGKLHLKKGDEVITTASAFPTTVNPIIQNGLIPVFIDVSLDDYNIDVTKIKKAISNKTRAIIVAHTLGNPIKLNEIMDIVNHRELFFIEDNADSLGSLYNTQLTGSFGHISTSSFYPAHHITMGEGGATLTNNTLLHKIMLSFRDWGRDCNCLPGHDNTCGKRHIQQFGDLPYGYDHKYVYSHIGYNLKPTDIQASIGIEQLKRLPNFIKQRRYNYDYLSDNLRHIKHIRFLKPIPPAQPSWFGFPMLVKNRGRFIEYLESKGIATRMLFGGNLLKQPAYRDIRYRVYGNLKNTDRLMNELCWIGVHPKIGKKELKYMVGIIDWYFAKR